MSTLFEHAPLLTQRWTKTTPSRLEQAPILQLASAFHSRARTCLSGYESTLGVSVHGMQLNSNGTHDFHDCIEAGLSAWRKGLVKAGSAQAGVFGNLSHATSFGHVANRTNELVSITFGKDLTEVFGNIFISLQVVSQIERLNTEIF